MDCEVEGGHVTAEQKQPMIDVYDTDVFVAVVLVPVRHPLVPRTCHVDWSVHLRQVRHVCVCRIDLLHAVTLIIITSHTVSK